MDISWANGFIESGTNSVSLVECLHLVLLHAGETRNTSTASTAVNIEDPDWWTQMQVPLT